MKKISIIIIMILVVANVNATIQGHSTAVSGQNYQYGYSGYAVDPRWEIEGGTITYQDYAGGTYRVFITWGSSTSAGYVRFCDGFMPIDYLDVTIVLPPVSQAATLINSTSFRANWSPSEGADHYLFDVSTTSDFTGILQNYNNLSVSATYKDVTGLNPNTTYYYRVRAYFGLYATGNSSTVNTGTGPQAPLAAASDNVNFYSFTACWNPSAGASGYKIDVSQNSNFSTFLSGYNNLQVNDTNQVVQFPDPNQFYYYRVRAVNSSGYPSGNSNIIKAGLFANYTSSIQIRVEGINLPGDIYTCDSMGHIVNYTIYDGLGRPEQSINLEGSPTGMDIVKPIVYDQYGREVKKYLPYASNTGSLVKTNILNSQATFYEDPPSGIGANDYPYAEVIFDSSALNRVIEQGYEGASWQPYNGSILGSGHTLKTMLRTNSSNDSIIKHTIIANDSCISNGFYSAKELYIKTVKDENWTSEQDYEYDHVTFEVKDKRGQVILKRTFDKNIKYDTYYVYDDLGLLRCVIPPLASGDPLETDLCYHYRYDSRKRMSIKKLPGADTIFMIYDGRDRLVALQDGNMRGNGDWLFTKYDAFNRPVLTGIYHPASAMTQSAMQQSVDQFYLTHTKPYEETTTNVVLGYTNQSFPDVSSIGSYLTATYYDNYDYPYPLDFNNNFNVSQYSDTEGNTLYFDRLTGKVTGTATRVLNSQDWLLKTMYYDDRGRIIQSVKENYPSGTDFTSNKYDFIGNPLKVLQVHCKTGTTESLRVIKDYEYDHMNRLLNIYHKVNNQDSVLMSCLRYNELGQLIEKNLHSSDQGASFTQSVDYRYNVRGWLQSINNANLTNDSGDTNDDSNDKFGMELFYDVSE